MATTDELKAFISKRGYDVEVAKNGASYIISIHSKTVEEVTNLLASIGEPGRFVVAVKLDDVIPTIGEILGVVKLKEDISKLKGNVSKLEEDMRGNMRKLTDTNTEIDRQFKESTSALDNKLKDANKTVNQLVDELTYIKQQSWWKRFLGVK